MPHCGAALFEDPVGYACLMCHKTWTPSQLLIAASKEALRRRDFEVNARAATMYSQDLEKHVAAERGKSRALLEELNNLKFDMAQRDPVYLSCRVSELEKGVLDMERRLKALENPEPWS